MNQIKPTTTHILLPVNVLDNVDIHELLCYEASKEFNLSKSFIEKLANNYAFEPHGDRGESIVKKDKLNAYKQAIKDILK